MPATVLRVVVAGQMVIIGDSLSNIVTLKLQVLELPDPSVAFQVTVVVPLLNTLPARVTVLVVADPTVAPVKV